MKRPALKSETGEHTHPPGVYYDERMNNKVPEIFRIDIAIRRMDRDFKTKKADHCWRLRQWVAVLGSWFLALVSTTNLWAMHPLITDDTGTQGRGKFQLEVNGEYGQDKDNGATAKTYPAAATLSYGLSDPMDLMLTLPYLHQRKETSEAVVHEGGLSDLSLEMKWRFYKKEGISLALKPGLSLPTGNSDKGRGAGKTTYRLFFIASREGKPWAFHLNLGYIRNENKNEERENLWQASVAATVEVVKDLKIAGNIGIESPTDRAETTPPVFLLGGVIYSLSDRFDLDLGIKGGMTPTETDFSILAGLTWRF